MRKALVLAIIFVLFSLQPALARFRFKVGDYEREVLSRYEENSGIAQGASYYEGQRDVGAVYQDIEEDKPVKEKKHLPTFLLIGLSFFLIVLLFLKVSIRGLFFYVLGGIVSVVIYYVFENVVFSQILAIICAVFTVYFVLVRETQEF